MSNNPLTNVYTRLTKNRSTSRPIPTTKKKYTKTTLISQMHQMKRTQESMSRDDTAITEVETQIIEDRMGDVPNVDQIQ